MTIDSQLNTIKTCKLDIRDAINSKGLVSRNALNNFDEEIRAITYTEYVPGEYTWTYNSSTETLNIEFSQNQGG